MNWIAGVERSFLFCTKSFSRDTSVEVNVKMQLTHRKKLSALMVYKKSEVFIVLEKRKAMVSRKPKIESQNKFLRNVKAWLKKSMHLLVQWQKKKLSIRLNGYYRYFGLRHCKPALEHVKQHVERLWITTLRRRSQRHNLHWTTVTKQAWFKLLEPFLKR